MNTIPLEYQILGNATTNIGRAFPQIQDYEGSISSTISFLRRGHRDALPYTDDLSFDRFIIEKSSKKTDLLSNASFDYYGLTISEKLISILKNYTIVPYKLYKAVIQKKGTGILYDGYYAFMIEKMMYRYLAFQCLEFRDVTDRNNKVTLKIKDVSEFEHLRYVRRRIISLSSDQPYIFTNEFPSEIDLFAVGGINSYDIFVSKRLREGLAENKITGIAFGDEFKIFHL